MDTLMAGDEDKYFVRWLEDKFKHQDAKIDANTEVTKAIAQKLTELEKSLHGEPSKKDLPPIYRDPKVIQAVLYLSIALMLLVAAAVRFDVSTLL